MSIEGDALGLAIAAAVKATTDALILANPGLSPDRDTIFKAMGNALFDTFAPNKLETVDREIVIMGHVPDGSYLARVGGLWVGTTGIPVISAAPTGPASGDLGGLYPGPSVVGLHETGGPADLLYGAIPDLTFFKRSGSTVIGVAFGSATGTICEGNDSRLSDSRAPTGAAGGNLSGTYPNPSVTFATTAGGAPPTGSAGGDLTGTYPNPTVAALAITDSKVATANKDGTAGTASMRTLGTGAAQACAGNDSRLSDSRAPTGSAGGDLTGTFPNPTVAALAITDSKVAAANKDGTSGTASMRTLGTGAAQACAGNDSRLSDSRAPSGSAGGDLTGTYPNPTLAAAGAGAATYGGGTSFVNSITLDSKGRPTAISTSVPAGGSGIDDWFAKYIANGKTNAGLTTNRYTYLADPFFSTTLYGWGASAPVAKTDKTGGVVSMPGLANTAKTACTALKSDGRWYMAARICFNATNNSSARFLVGVEDGPAANFIMFGVDGNGSTTKYMLRVQDAGGIQYVLSTVATNTAWHDVEAWYDGTHLFFSVDAETPVQATPTHLVAATFMMGRLSADSTNNGNCWLDSLLIMAPQAS